MNYHFFSILILSYLLQQYAEIIKYSNHIINPDRPEYLIIPKFSAYEVPNWYPGDGRSFIDLTDVIIHSSCDSEEKQKITLPDEDADLSCVDATFEVLMFEAPNDKPWFDYWNNGDYCCTNEVIMAGGCIAVNRNKLIIPDQLPSAFLRSTVVKPEGTYQLTEGDVSKHDISKSGIIVMIMALCDPSANPVVIDGAIESMEPC